MSRATRRTLHPRRRAGIQRLEADRRAGLPLPELGRAARRVVDRRERIGEARERRGRQQR